MVRTIFALFSVGLVVATAGCRVCSHPYDYCGPLFDGGGGQYCCCPNARAGSILSPDPRIGGCHGGALAPQVIERDVAPQPIPQNELTKARSSDVKRSRVKSEDLAESGPVLISASPDAGPMRGAEQKVRQYPRTDPRRWTGGQSRNTRR